MTPILAQMILDCANAGYEDHYDMVPDGNEYCITGFCGTPESSSSSDSDVSSSSSSSYIACATTISIPGEGNYATLDCPLGIITDIVFASYGTATGSCGDFAIGGCHAGSSLSVVSAACLGESSCTIYSHNDMFGDPCVGTYKRLYIQAVCGSSSSSDFSSSSSLSSGSFSSSSAQNVYEFCKENPGNSFCAGQGGGSGSSSSQGTLAKHNERDPNAVYTAVDCFSDGLDNMEPGKCYSLNPDRGTQYGWINNNAQDRWWWREVSCGGDDEDDEEEWELVQCSGSGFLEKKSLAEESYNSRGSALYDSYDVWGKNTIFFYDALGRKTQAHPETRRYLFSPNKTHNKERISESSEPISFQTRTYINGFVKVEHKYNRGWCTEREDGTPIKKIKCPPSTPVMGNLAIPLSFRTIIKRNENQNDSLLKIHEDKHVEIYNSLGNGDWKETIRIDLCKNRTRKAISEFCPEMKRIAKSKFEEQLRILINAQNKWDDDDINNASNDRIDLEERIDYMRQDVDSKACP